MKLYVAKAIIEDGMLCYVDDNDPVEVESFLGVHSALEKAQAFATKVANKDREAENDLIDENETGEAHLPELELSWDHQPRSEYQHERWTSDSVEFANRDMKVQYQVILTSLDPTL
jgi:hypothetical protein